MTETTNLPRWKCLNSTHLKILAMLCMLLDHTGSILVAEQFWLNCVGRIAFPIFAFQVAEGYRHTSDFKKYLKRLFLFALISEIPYNLMMGGIIYPFGQNVMFTFCIAMLTIRLIDQGFQKHKLWGLAALAGATLLGYFLGTVLFVDYFGFGVLMTVGFWFFRRFRYGWFAQLALMIYVNWEMIGGLNFTVMWQGREFWIPMQGFAVLAMLPIGLYNGKKGPGGKALQFGTYWFYPVHMLILSLIAFAIVL